MSSINTDKQSIDELLSRGVENVYPSKEFLEKELASGRKLTLYTGYDPTADTLHIGHGITMMKLRQFQNLGHKIIMLIGDFTGMIGDPTDKTSARQKLTEEEVKANYKTYKEQASAILDFDGSNPVEMKYNNDWLGKMNFKDVLELGSHFTVPQLMERDMFQKRLEDGKTIYLHEFLYPVMQAYDSVAMDVDGEVGGNDQTFNMLAGRTLLKTMKDKEKFVLTSKLLVDATGKKMGKSEGNMIALSDSPEDVFGKVMRWTDSMIDLGFELCTTVDMKEVKKIDSKKNPRDAKLRLAYEVTKSFLGEDAAEKGKNHFASVIQSNEKPENMDELDADGKDILTVLLDAGFANSKSEARRVIDGKGAKINDVPAESYDHTVSTGDVIQKGKRFFVKIK
jgi:tyrosyl-tRNA synthetase